MTQTEETTKDRILRFIENYTKQKGFVPLQSTIAKKLKMTRQNVKYHFDNMEDILKKYPEYQRYSYNQQPKEKGIPHVAHPDIN